MKSVSIKKYIDNAKAKAVLDEKDTSYLTFKFNLINYERNNMPYNIQLTDKCKELLFDDYEELREYGKANLAVEDEMLRHFLDMARKEGLVKSFSKKVLTVMEA